MRTREIADPHGAGSAALEHREMVWFRDQKLALLGCGLGVLGSLAVVAAGELVSVRVSATDPLVYCGARF